jgi:cytoskeletal protein CcmA (bactofilin family)
MFFSKQKFVGLSSNSMLTPLAAESPGVRDVNNNFFIKKNLKMRGELITDGSVIIEGEFEGLIKANKIKLAKTGKFKGRCEVQTAFISGSVNAELNCAQKLFVAKSAVIDGIINYGEIQIEPGALCQGQMNRLAKADD